MSFTFEGLTRNIITFLRDILDDPISRGTEWIYPDYPRVDATLPRISIIQSATPWIREYISNQQSIWDVGYTLDIWVDSKKKVSIGNEVYSGSKLREYLTDLVVAAFLDNKLTLESDYGIMDVILGSIFTHPYNQELDEYRKTIPLTFVVVRTTG